MFPAEAAGREITFPTLEGGACTCMRGGGGAGLLGTDAAAPLQIRSMFPVEAAVQDQVLEGDACAGMSF